MKEISEKSTRWFKLPYDLLSLSMLLALVAFSYATWSNVKQQAYPSLTPENQSLTHIVERFFAHQESLLSELASSITVTASPINIQSRLNDVLRASPQMRVLSVIDSQGTVIATTGNIHSLEWLDFFDSNASTIGRPFRPTFVGENVLPVRKPIINERGATIGYVVAAYRLLGDDAIWQDAGQGESKHRSMVIGSDGRVYLSSPESDTFWESFVALKVDEQFLTTLDELSQKAGELQTRNVHYQKEQLLITASFIEKYQFYIVSGIQEVDIFSRWLDRMKYVTLAILLIWVVGLVIFRLILTRGSRLEPTRNVAADNVFTLSKAIEQSPSSVIATDEHWVIKYANNRLFDGEESLSQLDSGRSLLEHFPHSLLKNEASAISESISNGTNWHGERRAKEQKQWFSFSVSAMKNDAGQMTNHVIVTHDITERKQIETRLLKQVNYDASTGFPNRQRTNELLSEALKKASQEGKRVAVLYMDVDSLKQVSDTFGHILGDQMLQHIAVRLKHAVAELGTVCYMGGDEFLVSVVFDSEQEVLDIADNIMSAMKQTVLLEGKSLFISVSIGISRFPDDSGDVSTLLKHADIALCESKKQGENCYRVFSQELGEKHSRKVELESEIRNAIVNKELTMAYQSKNKISSGDVYGFEAQVRWQSPHLGLVSPEEFIAVAEEVGVADQLGEFALYGACRDLKKLQHHAAQPLAMAVSVSMFQLTNSDIVGTVKRVLEDTGLNPSVLELEIVESRNAQGFEDVQPVLNELLGLGVSLSIDDFGTASSSLSYLTRFPVAALKIDQRFIEGMVENRSDATLIQTIVAMAHTLGLKVVAKGVENENQLALLRVYGCDLAQGDLFTTPLSYEQVLTHLKSKEEKPDWAI
jgi:diguanylate cyclase (GGDEF)-like protein/PAS domain S-box-containing protein